MDFKKLKQVPPDSIEARLFSIIDDIDTGSDMFKPRHTPYTSFVSGMVRKAQDYIVSDGYKLYYSQEDE